MNSFLYGAKKRSIPFYKKKREKNQRCSVQAAAAEVRQAAGGGALRAVRRTDSPKDADGGANAAGTPDSFFFGKQI